MGAQKHCLIEMVLLSTHNICFGSEIRKLFLCYALLTKVLSIQANSVHPEQTDLGPHCLLKDQQMTHSRRHLVVSSSRRVNIRPEFFY